MKESFTGQYLREAAAEAAPGSREGRAEAGAEAPNQCIVERHEGRERLEGQRCITREVGGEGCAREGVRAALTPPSS